jgi:hypothetical protein
VFRPLLQRYARYGHLPVADYGEPAFRVTDNIRATLRDQTYQAQWQSCLTNRWYHVRLEDYSLFVFDVDSVRPSYRFLDRPIAMQTFREFLEARDLPYDSNTRSEYAETYEFEMLSAPLRPSISPIRYDFDERAYRPGIHPVAHVHVGLENDIRISTRRAFTPAAFFLFVVRQLYPQSWARLVESLGERKLQNVVRANLTEIVEAYFGPRDHACAYLY